MRGKKPGVRVIDLFCGAGGFSQGFHMAGFDVVYGADFWKPACDTHMLNGLGLTERVDLLPYGVDDVLALKKRLEDNHGRIDILIGSPPCTEFSYAKKGGRGDIEKGMLLVRKHLLFVSLFRPKYWLMENVPRLEEVMALECEGSSEKGWRISYERLGIPPGMASSLGLRGDSLEIPAGMVHLASDYGTCENRKRYIVGNYPLEALDEFKVGKDYDISLGGLVERFEKNLSSAGPSGRMEDPNYPGHLINVQNLRDNSYDTSVHPMYLEEMRHLKRRHIQYGRMDLPDDLCNPARTIMATYNASSRESILLDTGRRMTYQGKSRPIYRQPTVRFVATIQGFPLDFQLASPRINDRYKLVGNAVPCQLSYALARCIREDIRANLKGFEDEFRERGRTTLRRANLRKGPIIGKPSRLVDEAQDMSLGRGMVFRARQDKQFRRKLLSAKLENDSSVVIFENSNVNGDVIRGGTNWRACLQMGVGSRFHRVYLDDVSVPALFGSLRQSLDSHELMSVVHHALAKADKGIPRLSERWVEFPGYNGDLRTYLKLIGKQSLRIPSVSLFQRMFTEDMKDIRPYVGPLDFFDGLDAIMVRSFSSENGRQLTSRRLRVAKVKDADTYAHRADPRIIPNIENASMPFVTVTGACLAVHVLRKMYEGEDDESSYGRSLRYADDGVLEKLDDIRS